MRCEFCGLLLSFLFENIFEDSNLLADVCGKLETFWKKRDQLMVLRDGTSEAQISTKNTAKKINF
jgi:hypothetical protein